MEAVLAAVGIAGAAQPLSLTTGTSIILCRVQSFKCSNYTWRACSKMQWLQRQDYQYGDPAQLIRELPQEQWRPCGSTACGRLTHIWATGSLDPIFVAYKYQVIQFCPEGMVFERSAGGHEELLLCRPNFDEIATVVTALIQETEDHKLQIQVHKLSGAELLNVTWPLGATWWKIAAELYEKHGICNLKIAKGNVDVPKQWWFKSVCWNDFSPDRHPGFIWQNRAAQVQESEESEDSTPAPAVQKPAKAAAKKAAQAAAKKVSKKVLKKPAAVLKRPSAAYK